MATNGRVTNNYKSATQTKVTTAPKATATSNTVKTSGGTTKNTGGTTTSTNAITAGVNAAKSSTTSSSSVNPTYAAAVANKSSTSNSSGTKSSGSTTTSSSTNAIKSATTIAHDQASGQKKTAATVTSTGGNAVKTGSTAAKSSTTSSSSVNPTYAAAVANKSTTTPTSSSNVSYGTGGGIAATTADSRDNAVNAQKSNAGSSAAGVSPTTSPALTSLASAVNPTTTGSAPATTGGTTGGTLKASGAVITPTTTNQSKQTTWQDTLNNASYMGYSSDGAQYPIGSSTGIDFVNGLSGNSMTGRDGSVWTRDPETGITTINKNGITYTVQGEIQQQQKQQQQQQQMLGYDISGMQNLLQQYRDAAAEQATNSIDYATQKAIDELNRAEEDAAVEYQSQREQNAINEAIALDNQALYAERRGDKGGIGQSQYNSIQNTAAVNALTINLAQKKLSTDTARQIADLRAQGEYEKADKLLEINQNYLSELIELQQWSLEFGLDIAQFNESIRQWEANHEMDVAELTGTYQGELTYSAKSDLAEAGLTLAQNGITPSSSQLSAMKELYGYDSATVNSIVALANQSASAKGTGNDTTDDEVTDIVNAAYYALGDNPSDSNIRNWVMKNAKYMSDYMDEFIDDYRAYASSQKKISSSATRDSFANVKRAIKQYLALGNSSGAYAVYQKYYNGMTDAERAEIEKLIKG